MEEPFVLHAPWVAGREVKRGRDTLRLAVRARNLRTGATISCPVGFGFNPGNKPSLSGIVLKHDGSVAWIGKKGGSTLAVGACDSTGERILDSGEGIDLESLKLHGSTVTWIYSGESRSAVLE
jgi:hypothetical protein